MDKYEASSVAGADMEIRGDDRSITVTWENGVFGGKCYSIEVVAAEHGEFFKALKKIAKDRKIQVWDKWTFDTQLEKSGLEPRNVTCPSR